jgi:hypothetical protein
VKLKDAYASRPPITTEDLQTRATGRSAGRHNLDARTCWEDEVQAIVECVQRNQSDLLVLGLHRRSLPLSRLWNHTTHDLVQQLSTSILRFHWKSGAAAFLNFPKTRDCLPLDA